MLVQPLAPSMPTAPEALLTQLPIEQGALALRSPSIAGQGTVTTYDPVAGDRYRKLVSRTGAGYGANGIGSPD